MKKQLLILVFLILVFRAGSYAQGTFAPVGAEWWYGGDCFDYESWGDSGIWWADHMQSVKDTTVLNKPARMLTATRYQQYASSSIMIGKRDTFYIYNTADTVFVYDAVVAEYTPLYIFNVSVGDTLCLRQPNSTLSSSSAIEPEFCIIIDSIKTEDYSGEQLISYYNHTITADNATGALSWGERQYVSQTAPYFRYVGKYTEKIGGNWLKIGSFFPESMGIVSDYSKQIGFPSGTLRCYTDSATTIKMVSEACDTIVVNPLSLPKLAKATYQVSVFPNPSSGTFRLTVAEPLKETLLLQVTDLSGKVLYSSQLAAGKTGLSLELATLTTGTYLLVLQAKAQRYYQKLVISR
ncbi:T9SS type A sorting domain-containing protein [Taibaiella helva]|uniref:T9SS type A sorting domain-containing protein n=1 Tax=Taibaiella helva TaxID=2301235 RepID=UPI00130049DA|nr:T9SS type A sorting domain-containing protein [Taibaiella helva]